MFAGTDMGAAFLEALDDLFNSAMPPEAIAASGGARSWTPYFIGMNQYNSSMNATIALITASTQEGPLGMSETNVSTLNSFGMVLQKIWTSESGTASVVVRRRRLAASQRKLATTNISCILPTANDKHGVTTLSIRFVPPAELVTTLGGGLDAFSEITTLINYAIAYDSPSMTAFSKLLANCTGSDLSVVLSAGKIEVVVEAAGVTASISTEQISSSTLLYAAGFGGTAAGCFCCAALFFLCKRQRRPRLLVLFDNNAAGGGLAAAAARVLVAEASICGSLHKWRTDSAPLCDDTILKPVDSKDVAALRAAADAIVVILAPSDKWQSSLTTLLCTVVSVDGTEAHQATNPRGVRHARDVSPTASTHPVCSLLLQQDAETALINYSNRYKCGRFSSSHHQRQSTSQAESNALRDWVYAFTVALTKLVDTATPSSSASSSLSHNKTRGDDDVQTLIAEFTLSPMRTLLFVRESPLILLSDKLDNVQHS